MVNGRIIGRLIIAVLRFQIKGNFLENVIVIDININIL